MTRRAPFDRLRTERRAERRRGRDPRRRAGAAGLVVTGSLALAACSSASSSPTTTAHHSAADTTLHVLVTNDDGVTAPGIDAAVDALRTLPHTQVTVVAPATNQSGTGGRTTAGPVAASAATTRSGVAATAVEGYPADTVIWAVADHHVAVRPDLVVSGINYGQNIGPLADLSGTVGAARQAVTFGIPALAVSQGLDDGRPPDFSEGAHQLLAWVTRHRAALLAGGGHAGGPSGNLNVPTCPNGVRGPVDVPLATSLTGVDLATVDCTSTATGPSDDAHGFVEGFAVIAPLGAPPTTG